MPIPINIEVNIIGNGRRGEKMGKILDEWENVYRAVKKLYMENRGCTDIKKAVEVYEEGERKMAEFAYKYWPLRERPMEEGMWGIGRQSFNLGRTLSELVYNAMEKEGAKKGIPKERVEDMYFKVWEVIREDDIKTIDQRREGIKTMEELEEWKKRSRDFMKEMNEKEPEIYAICEELCKTDYRLKLAKKIFELKRAGVLKE